MCSNQEFIIDGQEDVREPLGMSGVRLEVKVHMVTGAVSAAQNIIKCVRRCGLEVNDLILQPLASSGAVLVDVVEAQLEPLLAPDILPTFTPERLAAHGAQPLAALPPREAYALVELQNGEGDSEYVLGSRNFFVLTRYNRSSYYAMAVLHLGCAVVAEEALAQALDSQTAKIGANTGCGAC